MCAALTIPVLLTTARAAEWTGPPLAHQARAVALHGGSTGTCHGCATPRMRELMIDVYQARFARAGAWSQRVAVCVMLAESGGNPGAISRTSDYSGSQFNRPSHEGSHPSWWRPGRGFRYVVFDPWFSASRMWAMSKRGTSWWPWVTRGGCGA